MNGEELLLTQRLPMVGRDVELYPNLKPGRPGKLALPVSSPVGWWDASDTSSAGMTLDSAAMFVNTWKDKSGSGFDASPVSVSAFIGRLPTRLNRLPSILNGGAGYSCSLPADDRTQTIFVVGAVASLTGYRPLVGANNSGGRLFRIDQTTGKLSVVSQFTGNLFTTTTLAVTVGTPFVACAILDTSTIEIRLNSGTAESTSESTTFTAGRTSRIGQDANTGDVFIGATGEVLVYGTALSSANASAVMGYLMSKWGVT